MSKSRDEFSEKSKHIIASRVGYHCSRPDCQVPTCGPSSNTNSDYNIGVASHITAASEGFARYDKNLTPKQRKHPNNGIWMCQSHGKEIDDDEHEYPVDLLIRWKADAESRAKARLGKVPESAGGQSLFVTLSEAQRYGLQAVADLADGTKVPFASTFDIETDDLTFFAGSSFIVRFLIAKREGSPPITLYELIATVYDAQPLPKFKPRAYALPQRVYPFLLTLEPPVDSVPRPCVASHYCPPGESKAVPAVPISITDDCPEVIDVRFTAKDSGLFNFALDAVVMVGMHRHTYRVMNKQSVLMEKFVFPHD